MFSETQNLLSAFCWKWVKVALKNSLRSRGVLGLTLWVCLKASKKSQKYPEWYDDYHPKSHNHKRSQILMPRSKPLFSWPREILFFSFVHHFLTHSCLMFQYRVFFVQLETNLPISCLEAQNIFFVIQGFLFSFLLGEIKRFFSVLFYFHGGRKKGKITTGICGNGS